MGKVVEGEEDLEGKEAEDEGDMEREVMVDGGGAC